MTAPTAKKAVQSKLKRKSVTLTAQPKSKLKAAKRSYMPRLRPAESTVRYRQILAAEIVLGSLLILTNTPSADELDSSISRMVQQEAAYLMVMLILSTMTAAGPSAARVSAILGGLVFLTIMLKQKNIITRFGNFKPQNDVIPGASLPDLPEIPNTPYSSGGGISRG